MSKLHEIVKRYWGAIYYSFPKFDNKDIDKVTENLVSEIVEMAKKKVHKIYGLLGDLDSKEQMKLVNQIIEELDKMKEK